MEIKLNKYYNYYNNYTVNELEQKVKNMREEISKDLTPIEKFILNSKDDIKSMEKALENKKLEEKYLYINKIKQRPYRRITNEERTEVIHNINRNNYINDGNDKLTFNIINKFNLIYSVDSYYKNENSYYRKNQKEIFKQLTGEELPEINVEELKNELMLEIGNKNIPKRGNKIRNKNSSDFIIKDNYCNTLETYMKNFVFYAFNKETGTQVQVSFNKNDENYIGNYKNLSYNIYVIGYYDGYYDAIQIAKIIRDSRDDNNYQISVNEKECLYKYLLNIMTPEKAIDTIETGITKNNKKYLFDIIIKKYRINTKFSKTVIIDVDLKDTLEDTIKKLYIYKTLIDFKCIVVENKNNNHFSIIVLLSNPKDMTYINKIKNLFKITGICDPRHCTEFGKNVFNETGLFNIYYFNKGEYIDKYDLNDTILDDCFKMNAINLDKLGINLNNELTNVNDSYNKMLFDIRDILFGGEDNNNYELNNCIDFTRTKDFIEFSKDYLKFKKNPYRFTIIDKNNEYKETKSEKENIFGPIVISLNNKKENKNTVCYAIGYDKFCELLRKCKSYEELYNSNIKIIFKIDHRRSNSENFGFMCGSNMTIGLTLEQTIKLFDKLVIVDNSDNKNNEKIIKKRLIKGFNKGNEKRKRLGFYMYSEEQSRMGNLTTNVNTTIKVMFDIVNNIIKGINNNKLKETEIYLNKKHKNYTEFITNIEDILCNKIDSNKEIVNDDLLSYMTNWLYERTINNSVNRYISVCEKDNIKVRVERIIDNFERKYKREIKQNVNNLIDKIIAKTYNKDIVVLNNLALEYKKDIYKEKIGGLIDNIKLLLNINKPLINMRI